MTRSIPALATILLLATGGTARAQISYDYVRAAGLDSETATPFGERKGLGADVGASLEVLERMHVFADYQLIELDDVDFETETVEAGVGFDSDVTDLGSVFVDVSYLSRSFTPSAAGPVSGDDEGYGVSIGYRETDNQRLEFLARLDHVDYQDSGYSDTSLFTSMQFRTTQRLHIETGVNFAGNDSYWMLGVRYYLPSWVRRSE